MRGPLTDSNRRTSPYHADGMGVHGRALASTFRLQTGCSACLLSVQLCPRVPELIYSSRTRGLLSVLQTAGGRTMDAAAAGLCR
jgi:hypothetical protein